MVIVTRLQNWSTLNAAALGATTTVQAKTIANWEQGRSKPNAQAAILLKLIDRFPELLDEIATL